MVYHNKIYSLLSLWSHLARVLTKRFCSRDTEQLQRQLSGWTRVNHAASCPDPATRRPRSREREIQSWPPFWPQDHGTEKPVHAEGGEVPVYLHAKNDEEWETLACVCQRSLQPLNRQISRRKRKDKRKENTTKKKNEIEKKARRKKKNTKKS